ncbi:molybdenum cofactor biosynthesis protein B [Marisediminicola sp. LYQ134]|uniref:MogA/MoaB family molybdenum cofactor biosynthesis protein n=1 Tax=unclassified Marisediminicola TaxID=2618316 RepID=UPI003983D820
MSRRGVVVVASTRAATGVYDDRTGPIIRDWMSARGLETTDPVVVPDGPEVAAALATALAARPALLVTTGGTGISPSDSTPDATAALLDVEVPGFHEELRRRGAASTPFALLTRGVAGVAGGTFVVNLPGSTGGVRDGLGVLDDILDHVLDQIDGGHHDA